ncbi:hypothetical protein U8527_16565 [Kordia algicida OT-1]|uniref:Uncharacterized protein n=1 Tax=Kordia algicida OT-1 TaxID=391587 RepID=A9EAU4_9FLAO|nr:hypothetical protein [Kordia algicida]EDP94534.1 hypothetical protein KAOT1_10241 [Kordia algicida OT-1]
MSLAVSVGIAIGVVATWGVIGGMYRKPNSKGQNHPTGNAGGSSSCSHCREVKSYYDGLSLGIKILKFVWYGYKKIECAIQGCPI